MSKQTMIQYLQSCQRDMTDQVTMGTGFTSDEVMALMFEMGAQYIEHIAGGENISRAFLREPLYWAWWRQQWHLMDEVFINMTGHLTREDRRKLYRAHHENIDAYPDAVIWDRIHSTYQRMSQQVIEKHTKSEKLQGHERERN
jgi:hypothetical protein